MIRYKNESEEIDVSVIGNNVRYGNRVGKLGDVLRSIFNSGLDIEMLKKSFEDSTKPIGNIA